MQKLYLLYCISRMLSRNLVGTLYPAIGWKIATYPCIFVMPQVSCPVKIPVLCSRNQADSTGSKINKIVFHPGIVFKLKKGFSFTPRVAFESTGRYGLTQVLSKALIGTRPGAFGVSLVVAERFGNNLPTSVSYGIGFGLSF
ncbi:MAG: hypothetical protein ABIR06_14615 [Cyclobacteriaceae bacterium]